ncbi:hypothetical protein, partial [Paenibacillus sp. CCS19]|uniref:hypothetical protein n=1 Tax=Paenibacillus sp. CCS19 TaxID=3158387 RepID=UPI00295EB817
MEKSLQLNGLDGVHYIKGALGGGAWAVVGHSYGAFLHLIASLAAYRSHVVHFCTLLRSLVAFRSHVVHFCTLLRSLAAYRSHVVH